jgi:hypothetical protein
MRFTAPLPPPLLSLLEELEARRQSDQL